MSIIHPETIQSHPVWIQNLIDKGLVDEDGKTVIAKNFNEVALVIMENGIQVNNVLLSRFIDGKSGQPYSDSSIKHAVKYANTR
jgi:hypothetical protein